MLKRHVWVRTATSTATQPVVDRTPSKWEVPRPTSAIHGTTASPPGLKKWAPPRPRWAKPEQPQQPHPSPPNVASTSGKWRQSPTTRPPPNTMNVSSSVENRPSSSSSSSVFPSPTFTRLPSSSLSKTLGKWSLSDDPQHGGTKPGASASAATARERDPAPHTNRLPKGEIHAQKGSPQLHQSRETKKPSLPDIAIQPVQEDNRVDRKRDRKFKERGSLLSRHDNDVSIPHHPRVQNTRTSEKPKSQKTSRIIKVNSDISIPSVISVGNLARLLNVRLDRLQRVMVKAGMENETSYDYVLTSEYASLIAMEFNRNPIVNDEAAFDIYPPPTHAKPLTLPLRPPIVTIMGHVDHGKTTLLDTLRSSAVAKGEAGGITQHIGAFSVPVANEGSETRTITFLDTPGHAAFSAMRARGARVTDIVVLVVSADDGIMPQTREVLRLIEQENISTVVAINKIDKPGIDVENVQTALLAEGVQLEVFGGDVPSVPVSGLTGQGLDQLVETISAVAEMQDLRAEREGNIQGHILESNNRKGLGPVATVLLLRGCLKPGTHVICGTSHGKVRLMFDSAGRGVKEAYPGMAVTVTGWKALPNAGDEILQGSESDVKKAIANRLRKTEVEATLNDVEAINEQRKAEREKKDDQNGDGTLVPNSNQESGPKELRLIVKGDVSGSVEAVVDALQVIGNKVACVKIIASGVGDITESDVLRAQASGGTVVAFSVSIPRPVEVAAARHQVLVISSKIIYSLMDEVRSRVIALLPPIIETKVSGEATVLQLFEIQLKGKVTKKIAGCRVINGILEKGKNIRVVRDHQTVHQGDLDTLRHLRKDITEATKGMECGISIAGFGDIQEGDLLQVFDKIEKPGIL